VKIAILGAECTGKTTLAQALATALDGCRGRAVWVPETLRDWCQQNGIFVARRSGHRNFSVIQSYKWSIARHYTSA
jgi:Flp pilus assembly CpaF family ATPase